MILLCYASMYLGVFYAAVLAASVIAITFASPGTSVNDTATRVEPCAQISTAQAAGNESFDSGIALQCLRSVPLHVDDGQVQLQGLKALVQFQSTLAYLKDPPPGYLYPAVDIEGGIDTLRDHLGAGFYTNEYDFQVDIAQLIDSAYDGHFLYVPDIVKVFIFARQDSSSPMRVFNLFSISKDGVALPDVYDWIDQAALATTDKFANYTPSPVQSINGLNVENALNAHAAIAGRNQDPDANYNSLFPNLPNHAARAGLNGTFSHSLYDLGVETLVTFANGSEKHLMSVAHTSPVTHNFTGVTDGASFFQTFCTGPASKRSSKTHSRTKRSPLPSPVNTTITPIQTQVPYSPIPTTQHVVHPTAYPVPFAIAADRSVAGYLPVSQPDLAVLSLPDYAPKDGVYIDFEDVIRETLATAGSLGKKKLIVDLRGNHGGIVPLAYDTFKQLFPSAVPTALQNIHAHAAYNWWGEVTSNYLSNFTSSNATSRALDFNFAGPLKVNYRETLGAEDQPFSSWREFYGPHVHHHDNFTSLFKTNLSDHWQSSDYSVYGYINDTAYQPQTFAAEDIVLLQDGACASTCSIFAELMKNVAGVKTVVVGGRKHNGPMQGVGGVKGASSQDMSSIWNTIRDLYNDTATPAEQAAFDAALHATAWFNSTRHALKRAAPSGHGTVMAGVNYQNNIRPGDETVTPLQFVYEAADCRFFYTAAMYSDQELVWKQAYNLMWGNGTCVPGSTGHPSSQNITGIGEGAAPH